MTFQIFFAHFITQHFQKLSFNCARKSTLRRPEKNIDFFFLYHMEINKQRNQYFTPFCWSGKGFSSSLNDIHQIILRYFGNPGSSGYCCVTAVRASDSEKGRVPCCTAALPPKATSYLLMSSAVQCTAV